MRLDTRAPCCLPLPSCCLTAGSLPRLFPSLPPAALLTATLAPCLCRRKSINVLKDMFRDEMTKADWQLVMRLKKVFKID